MENIALVVAFNSAEHSKNIYLPKIYRRHSRSLMKKKALLLISLIVTVAFVTVMMVACNSIPAHKALNALWANKETAVYDVIRYSGEEVKDGGEKRLITRGEMTMETTRRNNETVTVGDETVDNFTGSLVTMHLELEDGSYMDTSVAFTSRMIPVAAYKKTFVKGYETETVKMDTITETKAIYSDNEYKYKAYITEKGTDTESTTEDANTIKLSNWDSSPYFDDLMLYHVARASFTNKSAFNPMSFTVPAWTEKTTKQVNLASVTGDEKIAANGSDELSCTKIAMSRVQTFPGTGEPNYVYFANEPIEIGDSVNSVSKTHIMVKIVERQMEYTLKSITGSN